MDMDIMVLAKLYVYIKKRPSNWVSLEAPVALLQTKYRALRSQCSLQCATHSSSLEMLFPEGEVDIAGCSRLTRLLDISCNLVGTWASRVSPERQ
jgi:hypothetical protein